MNSVVYCPNCGKPLQLPDEIQGDDYFICPSCSTEFANPNKVVRERTTYLSNNNFTLTKNQSYWLIAIVVVVILVVIGSLSNNKQNNSGNNSDTSSESIYYTNAGFYFATSKATFDRMMEYMNHHDDEALTRLLLDGLIVPLPKNTEVFLIKAGFSSTVIRVKGETLELWTTSNAIHQ